MVCAVGILDHEEFDSEPVEDLCDGAHDSVARRVHVPEWFWGLGQVSRPLWEQRPKGAGQRSECQSADRPSTQRVDDRTQRGPRLRRWAGAPQDTDIVDTAHPSHGFLN